MALTEAQFIALEGNVRKVWDNYMKMKKDYGKELYNIITKKSAQFTDYMVGAPGRMQKWQGSVAYDTFQLGYSKQYRANKYSTGIQVEADLWEDEEFEEIKKRVTNIAYGVAKTLYYESAAPFNEAFASTDFLTGDGLSICNASHLLIAGGDTQTNTGVLSLDYDNLETTLRAMEDWTDDRGDKMLVNGDMIIAAPYWRETCKKMFGSEKEAFVADNTINTYKDFSFLIHPLITGKKWFVVNRDLMKNGSGLNWFMRKDPRGLERDGAVATGDFNTEMISWKAVGRWELGATNWTWVYGHNAS